MVQHAEGAFEIDPEAVVNAEFAHVFRGYSIDEVRSFLEDVGRELHRLKNELAAARSVQQVVAATAETPLGLSDETQNRSTTSVGPGTVIDLQSHRLTLERDDNFSDLDSEISDARLTEAQERSEEDSEQRQVVPFPSAAPPQRRAVIDELFARLGEPQLDDVEWAKEVLIRTGEIPAIPESPYASIHGEAETISDHHDRLRSTVAELSRASVGQLKRNIATRLESLLPELKHLSSNKFEMSQLVPKAMDDEFIEGLTPFVAAAAKFGAGGTKVNVDGIPNKVARITGDWLRDRLQAHLDDDVAIEVRLRAVYREWKKSAVDLIATDAIAEAFALGLYATIPSDQQIKWETPSDGCCSTTCHDNASALTRRKGEEFPSGHLLPPIGPGCRSLVVPTGQ
ncbi:MAG: DivIVA domain-containing protein [Acidimicrobiales bacterium]|jgi:DivIVA domain-containing protein|nr:DivIVA domain-containing protein [Acidimicrobiales bacterium]MDP6900536.1 DivIVA domain-containing protein [Acidimicrobiales bacterium]